MVDEGGGWRDDGLDGGGCWMVVGGYWMMDAGMMDAGRWTMDDG